MVASQGIATSGAFTVMVITRIAATHGVGTINHEPSTINCGFRVDRTWSAGDKISLSLDMRCRLMKSPEGTPMSADGFRALVRGPIVLARDKRLGWDIHVGVEILADADGYVAPTPQAPTIPARMQFTVPTVDGRNFPVIDFETSGNAWDARSERVTWIPRPDTISPAGIEEMERPRPEMHITAEWASHG
jgi:hypothetical protein